MRRRWLSARAVLFHLILAVVAPFCLVAGWWQAHRALSGNWLSWAYTVEWPIFAVIAVVGWWQLIHEDPLARAARKTKPAEWVDPTAPGGPRYRARPHSDSRNDAARR